MRETQGLDRLLQDPEYRKTFQQEKLILEVTELISEAMKENEVSRADLARLLGRTRSYITQILTGSRNLTLRTWADAMTVLGQEARVSRALLADLGKESIAWKAQPENVPSVQNRAPAPVVLSRREPKGQNPNKLAA